MLPMKYWEIVADKLSETLCESRRVVIEYPACTRTKVC